MRCKWERVYFSICEDLQGRGVQYTLELVVSQCTKALKQLIISYPVPHGGPQMQVLNHRSNLHSDEIQIGSKLHCNAQISTSVLATDWHPCAYSILLYEYGLEISRQTFECKLALFSKVAMHPSELIRTKRGKVDQAKPSTRDILRVPPPLSYHIMPTTAYYRLTLDLQSHCASLLASLD